MVISLDLHSTACVLSCVQLCNPMDCSPPVSSVHGIFQVRILEWVVISFSRGSSWPRDRTSISYVSCIGRHSLYHWVTREARSQEETCVKGNEWCWRPAVRLRELAPGARGWGGSGPEDWSTNWARLAVLRDQHLHVFPASYQTFREVFFF